MSCRIAKAILVNEIDQEVAYFQEVAYLYDSVTGWAFGPQFESVEDAKSFLDWLGDGRDSDPRGFTDAHLEARYVAWLDWKQRFATPDGAIRRHS